MANEKNLVELYVDSIGVQDLREMLGAILNTMIFRPADVGDDGRSIITTASDSAN
jgi:hypothetical protein